MKRIRPKRTSRVVRTGARSRSREIEGKNAATTMISHPKCMRVWRQSFCSRVSSISLLPSLPFSPSFTPTFLFFLSFLPSFEIREIMPHGPFRHRRRQGVANELSRLFGLNTSTDPGVVQPTPTSAVDSVVAVTVPATSANTPVSATSQAQPCAYLRLLRIRLN